MRTANANWIWRKKLNWTIKTTDGSIWAINAAFGRQCSRLFGLTARVRTRDALKLHESWRIEPATLCHRINLIQFEIGIYCHSTYSVQTRSTYRHPKSRYLCVCLTNNWQLNWSPFESEWNERTTLSRLFTGVECFSSDKLHPVDRTTINFGHLCFGFRSVIV